MKPASFKFVLFLYFLFLPFLTELYGQKTKMILPIGHTGNVASARFSPDGKKIATSSSDFTAKIWDSETGNLLLDLKKHTRAVNSVEFSPDGLKIVTASADHTAKIWDAGSGTMESDLPGHTAEVNLARFSPDGNYIITISNDKTAILWNAFAGERLFHLKRHSNPIIYADFSPDSKKLLTVSLDGTVKVWNTSDGNFLLDINMHKRPLAFAEFSPDGHKIVTAYVDGVAKIWDANSGNQLQELAGHTSCLYSARFSPDGKRIVTASIDHTAKIFNAENGNVLKELKGHTNWVRYACFSPDGKKVLTSSDDSTMKLWDAGTGAIIYSFRGHENIVNGAEFSRDGKKIVSASRDHTAIVWDALKLSQISGTKGHTLEIYSAVFCSDNTKILLQASDLSAKIWNVNSGSLVARFKASTSRFNPAGDKIVTTWDSIASISDANTGDLITVLKGHKDQINFAQFAPDGMKILTVSSDSSIKVWNTADGILLLDIKLHTSEINPAEFSPDGKTILEGFPDGMVKTWDVTSGTNLLSFQTNTEGLNSAHFSPDGKKIITGSNDSCALIWNADSGTLFAERKGYSSWVLSAIYSPDTKKILSYIRGKTLTVWDENTGTKKDLNGHTGIIRTAEFSTDGKKIISSASDMIPRIWEDSSGKCILLTGEDNIGHSNFVNHASFSPDGKLAVTTSADNTCKIWDALNGKLLYTFVAIDSNDYLLLDKEGRFDGTEGARKLLYYLCASEIINLEQLKYLSWEPGLSGKIIGLNPEPVSAKKFSQLEICYKTPLVENLESVNGFFNFRIQARNGRIGLVELFVNNKLINTYDTSNMKFTAGYYYLSIAQTDLDSYLVSGNDNKVMLKAKTEDGTMSARGRVISLEEKKAVSNPDMYIVSIGISQYKGEKLQLKYASKDAIDFASTMVASSQNLLNTDGKQHVFSYVFHTEPGTQNPPTKAAIQGTLENISQHAKADDILLIFFGGHGILQTGEKKTLYLLTMEATSFEISGVENEVAITTAELTEWMRKIKASKQLLILDACNSGLMIEEQVASRDVPASQQRALEDLKEKTGTYILSASASGQSAFESGYYNHGLLTYTLLSTIKFGTGLKDDEYIDVTRWFNAAAAELKSLSIEMKHRQDPQIIGNASFQIGLANKAVKDSIRIFIKKKIFRRSKFFNEQGDHDDYLGIDPFVNNQLNEISSKGGDSAISFIPDCMFDDAYNILGPYTLHGNTITIKVHLMKGNKEILKFEIRGELDNKEELAKKIVERVNSFFSQ